MYYLDFHQLYKVTTLAERSLLRKRLTKEVRDEFMKRRLRHQHHLCFWCGVEIDMTGHLDHIIPIYYGGTNQSANLVATCRDCNMTKMTDQIEITNPYTINDYLKLREVFEKWELKVKNSKSWHHKNNLLRYRPKRVRLYRVYRADLFTYIDDHDAQF